MKSKIDIKHMLHWLKIGIHSDFKGRRSAGGVSSCTLNRLVFGGISLLWDVFSGQMPVTRIVSTIGNAQKEEFYSFIANKYF